MSLKKYKLKHILLCLSCVICSFGLVAQGDTRKIKAQIGLGVGMPSSDGFVEGFEGQSVNFPSVNIGFQYMLMPKWGGKLDYNFNRISNNTSSEAFKLNYARINLQAVFDASTILSPSYRIGTFLHAGPGISMVKPLGNYGENKVTFLNTMAGIELHYGVSDNLTVYLDTSYIFGFGKDFNPISNGFGSFNGNLLTITFGVSISLSGCYYCND